MPACSWQPSLERGGRIASVSLGSCDTLFCCVHMIIPDGRHLPKYVDQARDRQKEVFFVLCDIWVKSGSLQSLDWNAGGMEK